MTAERMASVATSADLQVISQIFRNDSDCVSVLGRLPLDPWRKPRVESLPKRWWTWFAGFVLTIARRFG